MRFPDNFIQEVVDRTDMEELVGRYVSLKRSGSKLWACCPFHSEKTPSFSVDAGKKLFYCFGCQAGGSAITFVQKAENLDFAEAVELLANRAGLPIPRESGVREEQGISRKRITEMNLEAAKFFRACLFDESLGKDAMHYFHTERALSMATIKHFGLGFAPDSFNMLTNHMHRLGYSDEELIAASLCGKSQKTGRAYDFFRNRVIFPIIDVAGNVIGFGGRVMDDSKPKYLNTTDTPAFNKRKNLFALNFAKNCCTEKMILCEGYMDVIAMHAAGFEYAVATLGTAITPEQARMFVKYTQKVIISYDADGPGQNAANKAMQVLGEVGMDVRVLKLNGAKDPDEYIRKYGVESFRRVLDESKTGFDHKTAQILARHDISIGSERIKATGEICALIAEYWSGVEREIYISEAAKRLELPADVIKNSVEQIRRKKGREARARDSREAQASVKNYGDRVNPDAARDPRAAAAEETVLGLLLLREEYCSAVEKGEIQLSEEDFVTDFNRRVFVAVMRLHQGESGLRHELLGLEFSPDEMGRIEKTEMARQQLHSNGPEVLRSAISALKEAKKQDTLKGASLNERLAYLREKRKNT